MGEEDEVTPGRFHDGEFKMICRQGRNVAIGVGLPDTTPTPTEEAVTEDSQQTTANVDPATTRRPMITTEDPQDETFDYHTDNDDDNDANTNDNDEDPYYYYWDYNTEY